MVNSLARKWRFQVALVTTPGVIPTTGWTEVNGLTAFTPNVTPNNADSSDFSTNGWASVEPTMQSWTLKATLNRLESANVYDPGQELIRGTVGQFGAGARLAARWFDREGGPEANQGIAIPTWDASSGGIKDLEAVSVTMTGTDVALDQNISNPYQATLAPVIMSVSPAGQVEGEAVLVEGANFTGVTGVTVGGGAATSYVLGSDQLLSVVLPTVTAGTVTVVVTTGVGASAGFNYTAG